MASACIRIVPETVHGNGDKDYKRLRQLIEQSAPNEAKKKIPIISGEWGYSSNRVAGVSLEKQADFIARQQLSNLLHEVPISIWYDWKNDGEDVNEREHNFGTVTNAPETKAGLCRDPDTNTRTVRLSHRKPSQHRQQEGFCAHSDKHHR